MISKPIELSSLNRKFTEIPKWTSREISVSVQNILATVQFSLPKNSSK